MIGIWTDHWWRRPVEWFWWPSIKFLDSRCGHFSWFDHLVFLFSLPTHPHQPDVRIPGDITPHTPLRSNACLHLLECTSVKLFTGFFCISSAVTTACYLSIRAILFCAVRAGFCTKFLLDGIHYSSCNSVRLTAWITYICIFFAQTNCSSLHHHLVRTYFDNSLLSLSFSISSSLRIPSPQQVLWQYILWYFKDIFLQWVYANHISSKYTHTPVQYPPNQTKTMLPQEYTSSLHGLFTLHPHVSYT